jgi:hypothetical protein
MGRRFILTGYAPLNIPRWKTIASRYLSASFGNYNQGRYILYDYNSGDPANRLEPYSFSHLQGGGGDTESQAAQDMLQYAMVFNPDIYEGEKESAEDDIEDAPRDLAIAAGLSVLGALAPRALCALRALRNASKAAGRGMRNPTVRDAAARGRQAHRDFAEKVKQKPGWQSEPTIRGPNGEKLRPDALDPQGRPVELKPDTATGRRQGAKQIEEYKEATGTNGRVVYYDP